MGYVDDSAEASQEPSATGLSVVRGRPTPRRRFLPPLLLRSNGTGPPHFERSGPGDLPQHHSFVNETSCVLSPLLTSKASVLNIPFLVSGDSTRIWFSPTKVLIV